MEEQQRVSSISLTQGLCEACQLYDTHYDRQLLEAERQWFSEDVSPESPALLALSGGKDSLTALYLLADVLQVPTRAFLYQNGFIPASVIEQAQHICQRYDVELDIIEHSLTDVFEAEYPYDDTGVRQARTGVDFCRLCTTHIQRIALRLCQTYQSRWIVFGNKVYTELTPYVSSIKTLIQKGQRYHSMNLLYTLGIQNAHQQYMLKRLGWKDPGLTGYTSNCLIPGLVSKARERKLRMHNDQGYIERELRSGAYTHQEAWELLKGPHGS